MPTATDEKVRTATIDVQRAEREVLQAGLAGMYFKLAGYRAAVPLN